MEEEKKTDEYFMKKALVEAEAARDAGEIPIGAILLCGNRIIARGHYLSEMLHYVTAYA